ncbi:hypothetical protein B0J14DRAFT_606156 [Halenospora varia]|nr:hypothetical protein B0J14DRAFT_606156 [Halenospora varia]
MSGAEAILVLGVIASVISIIDGTKQVYDAASSTEGLPQTFREVAYRLPIVRSILNYSKQQLDSKEIDETVCNAIEPVIKACEEKAKKLDNLFQHVLAPEDASRLDRYFSAAKTLGKGGRVETLMKGMLEDVQLLVNTYGMRIPSTQAGAVTQAIEDVSSIAPSIPESIFEEIVFTNNQYGNGPTTNYNVHGDQYSQTNTGPGKQFQAASQVFNFSKDD